jgi:DNA-binding LytR/AlgR family response regulator
VIRYGDHLKSIPVEDITFFKSESKATFIILTDGKRYLIDFTMDQVSSMVDPAIFFRINRSFMINIHFIKDIIAYSNSRLRLILKSTDNPDMIVAREKVNDFKQWLNR